jgi:hypothetical protein
MDAFARVRSSSPRSMPRSRRCRPGIVDIDATMVERIAAGHSLTTKSLLDRRPSHAMTRATASRDRRHSLAANGCCCVCLDAIAELRVVRCLAALSLLAQRSTAAVGTSTAQPQGAGSRRPLR